MNSVFDTLFLRVPRLHYVSPAICEVLFSSSAEPTIVLDPISRYSGPTGPVRGGTGGNYYFRWSIIPGLLCYTVYRADNNEAVYEPLYECLNPGAIVICSGGNFEIFEQTAEGETSVTTFTCDGVTPVITVMVSTVNTIGYKVVKNGVLTLWEGIMPPIIEICEPGCYKVSGISPDGETALSDEICYECTEELPCDPSEVWSWDDCACVTCPEEPCVPGTHWDAATCQCIADAGPCSSYIDQVSEYDAILSSEANAFGTAAALTKGWDASPTARHMLYLNRVETEVTTTGGEGWESVTFVTPSGDLVGETWGLDFQNWMREYDGTLHVFGVGLFGIGGASTSPAGVTNDKRVYFTEHDGDGLWHIKGWHPTEGIFYSAPVMAAGWDWGLESTLGFRSVSPGGWVLCGKWLESSGYAMMHTYKWGVGMVDTGFETDGWSHGFIDDYGRAVFRARATSWDVSNWNIAYWDGASITRVTAVTPGACALSSMTRNGIVGGTIDGVPFIWNSVDGIQSLGMPPGASSISNVRCTDAGAITVRTNIGTFCYLDGSYQPVTVLIPIGGTNWSAVTAVSGVNWDGYATGWGTYLGSAPTGFVAKMCVPA